MRGRRTPIDEIPRQTVVPDQFRGAVLGYKRHISMEFDFRPYRKGVKRDLWDYVRYRGTIATNNPDVNLQDEWCLIANLIYLGHHPPTPEFMIVIEKPTGWRKLKVVWVHSKSDLKRKLRDFRTGAPVKDAFNEKYRKKHRPEVPEGGWGKVL